MRPCQTSGQNPDTLSFADVTIEVDATKKDGPDDNDFGVICRYQDVDHFYYGIISSDGYFGLIKVTSDGSNMLGSENMQFSDLINQDRLPTIYGWIVSVMLSPVRKW